MKYMSGMARLILAFVAIPLLTGCSLSLSLVDPASQNSGTKVPLGPPPGAEILASGVWRCPEDLTGAKLIASLDGETYYWPDCGGARTIELADRICFESAEAARAYGLKPCNSCP